MKTRIVFLLAVLIALLLAVYAWDDLRAWSHGEPPATPLHHDAAKAVARAAAVVATDRGAFK